MRRYITRACIAAALLAISAAAYSYAAYAKWPSSPVTFYVNPANADVSPTAATTALQYAMNVWSTAGSSFRFQYGGTTTATTTGYDNRNVVLFRNATSGSAIASTYSWWDSSKRLLDSDVVFWDGGFKFYTGTSGCGGIANSAYVEDIATHELGHALGLNHSSSSSATMYPSYGYCSQAFRTLASDDVDGLKALYPGTPTNTAPTVTISSPADGATFVVGSNISLSATATDTQDGSLTSKVQWTDNDVAIGSGGLLSKVFSVAGVHVLVARVTDSGGLQGSKQISITITALPTNTAPVVTISSPANGATFVEGAAISFAAMASDTQDGNLTSKVQWTDNGVAMGSGGLLSKALSRGTHTIVAKVTDSGALQGSSQVSITVTAPTNTAPVVTITSPANGATFAYGTVISFAATASDTQDGNVTSKIQWTDNGVAMGSGGLVSKALTTGTHTIMAKVTDSGGLQGSKQVSITVTAATNTAPVVTITSPTNGATFAYGAAISFAATASDTQDGSVTSKIQWTDNGVAMGSGGLVSKALSSGAHTIVAKVTDSGGLQGSSQVSITVTAASTTTGTLAVRPAQALTADHQVSLQWLGVSGANVDVYRNGVLVYPTVNDGAHTDLPGTKYPTTVTHTYKVCATGTTTCTNTASATFY